MQGQSNQITSVHMLPIWTGAVGEVSGRKTNRKKNIMGLVWCDGSGGRGLQQSLATRSRLEREERPQSGALTFSVHAVVQVYPHSHTSHTYKHRHTHNGNNKVEKRTMYNDTYNDIYQCIMIHTMYNDTLYMNNV